MKKAIMFFGILCLTNACPGEDANNGQPWTFIADMDTGSDNDTSSDLRRDVTIEPDAKTSDMFVGKICDASPEILFKPRRNLEELEFCELSLSSLSFVDYFEEAIPPRFIGSLRELGPEANLTIYRVYNLQNLDGFTNLEKIGGGFTLSNADVLSDIDGLQNLRSVGANLEITALPIATLDGLKNLEYVGQGFRIEFMSELRSFDGLKNLEYIGGDFAVYTSSQLRTFEGLESLRKIEGDVSVKLDGMTEEEFRAFVERVEIGGEILFQGEPWPSN